MARRPLEREQVYLDRGRRTTQLMRDSLDSMTHNVRKALLRDYPCFIAAYFLGVFWLATPLAILLSGSSIHAFIDTPLLGPTAIIWTAVFSSLLIRRLLLLSRLFKTGQVSRAQITRVYIPRGRYGGPFAYYFTFQHAGSSVHARVNVANLFTRKPAFVPGESVEVLFDPSHPTRALILTLYQSARAVTA